MSDASVEARSRAAFARRFPDLCRRIEQASRPGACVVETNGEVIDFRLDGSNLVYGTDARQFSRAQVDSYMKKPLRFFMHRLDQCGIVTAVGQRLIKTLEDHLRGDALAELATHPVESPTFLICLGLGLGYHLEELTRKTEARWLILVEPLLEFFEPSFAIVDWEEIFAAYERRGGDVRIITETDPQRIVGSIAGIVNVKGIPYTDGSWVFTHYPFWSFAEARNRLHEVIEFTFINRGFFEDELVMMGNAVKNFAACDFRLLEGRPRLRRPETAVIVGAGPSLDTGIEVIRRFRDRMILFSAGTALRALLSHGITPDFQCELENVPGVFDVLTETSKIGDFSKITLLASATVDPRVPALFPETVFYFRDTISATRILGGKHRIIEGTSPTCVNLALNAAAVMGFTDFALFGTDCGVRPGNKRHAKGTIYNDVAAYEDGNKTQGPTLQVEGNFGGVVATEIIYDACRQMLTTAITSHHLNVVNCSDGALIPGASPRVPEALEILTPVVDAPAFKSELRRAMPHYAPGAMLKEADFDAIRDKTKQMFGDLDELLQALGKGRADFGEAYERIERFSTEAKDKYAFTDAMITGSLRALPRIGMFYGFRLMGEERRRELFDLFIREFRAIVADMMERTLALFEDFKSAPSSMPARLAANGGQ